MYFAMMGIGCGTIEYEISQEFGLTAQKDFRIVLLTMNFVMTILLVLSLYISYRMYVNWLKSRNLLTEQDGMWNSGVWRIVAAECTMCAVCPLPFFWKMTYGEYNKNLDYTITYRVNDPLLCIMFGRIYLLVRWALASSIFMNPRAQRVCQMHGCDPSYMFAIKCLMKQKPYFILWSNLFVSMFCFGFAIRIFDQPLSDVAG